MFVESNTNTINYPEWLTRSYKANYDKEEDMSSYNQGARNVKESIDIKNQVGISSIGSRGGKNTYIRNEKGESNAKPKVKKEKKPAEVTIHMSDKKPKKPKTKKVEPKKVAKVEKKTPPKKTQVKKTVAKKKNPTSKFNTNRKCESGIAGWS